MPRKRPGQNRPGKVPNQNDPRKTLGSKKRVRKPKSEGAKIREKLRRWDKRIFEIEDEIAKIEKALKGPVDHDHWLILHKRKSSLANLLLDFKTKVNLQKQKGGY